MLHQDIKEQLLPAMKSKEVVKIQVIKALLAAFTNEALAQKKRPDEMLSDEEVLAVISKQARQRRDSIEQFEKGGRADLVATEQAELDVIEKYLPAQMSEGDIAKVVEEKIEQLALEGEELKQAQGKLIGAVMRELKGKTNGAVVKKVVEERIA